jgi:hypothetical protein
MTSRCCTVAMFETFDLYTAFHINVTDVVLIEIHALFRTPTFSVPLCDVIRPKDK